MSRLLPLLIVLCTGVLLFCTKMASAADAYDVLSECMMPRTADKCGLTMMLRQKDAKKLTFKKFMFKVNGAPVWIGYNDKTPLTYTTPKPFSATNVIPVTCGTTYKITAYVVKEKSNVVTRVGDVQPVACPARVAF